MTLFLKLDLDMIKMYYHAKIEVSMSRHSKVIVQMDRQYENITFPHMRVVKIEKLAKLISITNLSFSSVPYLIREPVCPQCSIYGYVSV